MVENYGKIISVKDYIIEVEFPFSIRPKFHDILTLEENKDVKMEVYRSSGLSTFFCIGLTSINSLYRGAKVVTTNNPLLMPVGKKTLGRVIDIFGNPKDGLGDVDRTSVKSIYGSPPSYSEVSSKQEVLETGIKVVDLFSPLLKGGKTGLFGGSGVGKTIMLTEILHNIIDRDKEKNVSVFCGIGERTREGHELYHELEDSGVLPMASLIFGSMGDNPSVRFLTSLGGVTQAEHFRDELKKDVLFFVDNMYRFAQAGNELSLLMNQIPSEDGYQSTLTSEMAMVHERLVSNNNAAITTIEAIYLPSDDILDQGVQSVLDYIDSQIVLSRDVYREVRFPAVDILTSGSSALNPGVVSAVHYMVALQAQSLLKKAQSLERIVSLIGESELSEEDRINYQRAKKVRNYMTQNFFVAATQTGKPGSYVPIKTTVADVKAIMEGKYDGITDDKFLYIGNLSDIK